MKVSDKGKEERSQASSRSSKPHTPRQTLANPTHPPPRPPGTWRNGVIGDHMPPYKVVRDAVAAREAAGGFEKLLRQVCVFGVGGEGDALGEGRGGQGTGPRSQCKRARLRAWRRGGAGSSFPSHCQPNGGVLNTNPS